MKTSISGTVAARLREARAQMRLTQRDFAERGGVGLGSQNRYESGEAFPPLDYLLRIGERGADWYWIVTGERIGLSLSEADAEVLDLLSRLSLPDRAAIVQLARSLADARRPQTIHSPKLNFTEEHEQ